MKVLTIVGARPQFIKAAPVSRVLRKYFTEVLVHTGQHYDADMSDVFFSELGIPMPDHELGVGGGGHAEQTGRMLERLAKVFEKERPDYVLVYGDTNSTLAGALVASKLNIPLGHVEAGLRSFNKTMPEEINRIVADHCASQLFCPTDLAVRNLRAEGIRKEVHKVGDVMYDSAIMFGKVAENSSQVLNKLKLTKKGYNLLTIHRQSNTDIKENLGNILTAVASSDLPVIFPVHPRTVKRIREHGLSQLLKHKTIQAVKPAGYLDFLCLQKHARKILTDSGGVQKEAYFNGVTCITLRDETEWVETVEHSQNILVGTDPKKITRALKSFDRSPCSKKLYGRGDSAARITQKIVRYLRATL